MFGCEQPLVQICLEASNYTTSGRLFGIAEYLSACAILLLVLSVSDYRYRLRLSLAGFGGQRGLFVAGVAIGIALMLVEFWFLKGMPVPAGMNDLALIQLVLGVAFLSVVLYCCWAVFVQPPVFSARSAARWASVLYGSIGVGDQEKLAVLAAQLELSIKPIFDVAGRRTPQSTDKSPETTAWLCIQLMGDPRMVRALVRSAPWTVEEIFYQFKGRNLRNLPAENLATSIGTELITAKESPLRWEVTGYTGYFKDFQPIGTAVFGDSELVEELSYAWGPLAVVGHFTWHMDPEQLENYAEATLIFSRDLIRGRRWESRVLSHALDNLSKAGITIGDINGRDGSIYDDPAVRKFRTVIDLLSQLLQLMDKAEYKYRGYWREDNDTIPARVAGAIVELIEFSTSVKAPKDTAWFIHHNSLWGDIWSFHDGPIHRLVQRMVRREIYLKIKEMDRYANFQSARLLGYTLTIMGVSGDRYYKKQFHPLKAFAVGYAKQNYLTLRRDYPNVAKAVLIGSITFDEETGELVKTYAEGVSTKAPEERLKLNPPRPIVTNPAA